MKPYRHRKLAEGPDVADIQGEGRKSSVGRVGSERGYTKNAARKRATRRSLKRADKARDAAQLRADALDAIMGRMSGF